MEYKAIDLFAGIGGIRLGFEEVFDNFKIVFSNEINKFSAKTYQANFGDNPIGDITKVNPKKIPDFDILLGGFPCQSFSRAGAKLGFEDIRGTLFFNLANILRIKKPKAFLLENVKNLIHHNKGKTFQVIKNVLERDLGYNIHVKILNAKNFGLPQNRARIYIVGFKENLNFNFPKPTNNPANLTNILEPRGSVAPKYYMSKRYLKSLRAREERHIQKGSGFRYKPLKRNQVANTLVCGGSGHEMNLVLDRIIKDPMINNEGIRRMTPREWARLQGFPESFKFPVSNTQIYKQLANSVPVNVIKEIAKEIKKTIENYM